MEESIIITENVIKGNNINIATSLKKVAFSSTLDFVGGKISNAIQIKSDDLLPKNYSTYACDIRRTVPTMSSTEVKKYYNSYVKNNNTVKEIISLATSLSRKQLEKRVENYFFSVN